jgi:hypothetical protein
MPGRFSWATLLLLLAIAAVGVGSLRTAIVELPFSEDAAEAVALRWPVWAASIVGGGLLGMAFGAILGSWNQRGLVRHAAGVVGGSFLGAAAGAQCTVRSEWPVLFVAPMLLIGGTLLVALNERRRRATRQQ